MTRLVVIEGVPGVGKSTVAGLVAERLGAAVLRLPDSFRMAREAVGMDPSVPSLARLAYYLAGMTHLGAMIRERLAEGPVVCDRYLASALALAEAGWGLTAGEIDELSRPFVNLLPMPDITIVLDAPHAITSARQGDRHGSGRADQPDHHRAEIDPAFAAAWADAIGRWSARLGHTITIDTGSNTADQVAGEVLTVMEADGTPAAADL